MHRICAILSVGLVVVLVPGRAAGVPAAASGYVAEALANNLGLAGQALDVEQARSRLAEVRGALQPRLDLMARYSRADGGRTIDFPTGDLLNGAYLQGDDTGFPVQDGDDGALRKGRMWAFTDQEQVFYRFTATKEGKYPAEMLQKFTGNLLLVDGGSEFNEVVRKQGLQRGGCWSHCRTYFYNARHFHPQEAKIALKSIRDLFLLERELHGGDLEHIRTVRRETAKPAIDVFFQWLEALSSVTRPKSALGEAIRYTLNQREPLCLHLENPELPMHNNVSELMLRQTVVGRKNWLFARSEGGAEAAGHLYTLIGSCKLQGIDPHAYLVDVLGRIQDHPANRVAELTPKAWRRRMENHPGSAA